MEHLKMDHDNGMWEQKWVIGNWKMNGRLQNNNALMHRFRILPTAERVLIGLAAPTVYLLQLHNAMQIVLSNRILTCAQDVSRFPNNGAYTGEVSAEMLADIGTDIVLIGHSERSLYFGEKNEIPSALHSERTEHRTYRRRLRTRVGHRYGQSRHGGTNRRHARIYLSGNLVIVRQRC